MSKISRRVWTWRFEAPRERLWPALADTARFNEAAGFPKHVIDELPQPDGSVVYIGRARFGPFEIRWRDPDGNPHEETFQLKAGWHTIRLAWPAAQE